MNNLYIVATPIGNLQDITLRAASTLLSVPIIITESTSKAGILFDFLEKQFGRTRASNQKVISMTENEEELKIGSIIQLLGESDIALISEAGTPLISDPGFKLVREAVKRGVTIIPIPGPSSPIAALSASGLPTDKFFFIGFLPKSVTKKEKLFSTLKNMKIKTTIIAFDSPIRILETLESVDRILGDVDVVLAREVTKIHEEFIRESAKEILNKLKGKNIKGEITLIIS